MAVSYTHLYGLLVESEPDEGTRVSIRIPAVPYTEENCKILEKGHIMKTTGESCLLYTSKAKLLRKKYG